METVVVLSRECGRVAGVVECGRVWSRVGRVVESRVWSGWSGRECGRGGRVWSRVVVLSRECGRESRVWSGWSGRESGRVAGVVGVVECGRVESRVWSRVARVVGWSGWSSVVVLSRECGRESREWLSRGSGRGGRVWSSVVASREGGRVASVVGVVRSRVWSGGRVESRVWSGWSSVVVLSSESGRVASVVGVVECGRVCGRVEGWWSSRRVVVSSGRGGS
ncbi:hypothetical protein EGW08_019302 [Elysia chlorotica]|uniref:Uncharacterized protein n=1 Tax=Elysia chlorotica TaxID=188477 RepID=A0A433SUG0_ELYCH|nr:hypothetical protein EGW08_019302 [Elysia chlorotica]